MMMREMMGRLTLVPKMKSPRRRRRRRTNPSRRGRRLQICWTWGMERLPQQRKRSRRLMEMIWRCFLIPPTRRARWKIWMTSWILGTRRKRKRRRRLRKPRRTRRTRKRLRSPTRSQRRTRKRRKTKVTRKSVSKRRMSLKKRRTRSQRKKIRTARSRRVTRKRRKGSHQRKTGSLQQLLPRSSREHWGGIHILRPPMRPVQQLTPQQKSLL
mmetsp:Transcript_3236/g.5204  ORF Transcript_3236/g.5204 Transcript_3236/m.5204 type:complete len:212 (+) Transcript_3236:739-1374(+)